MLKQLKKIFACFAAILLIFVLGFVTLSAYSVEFDSSSCSIETDYNYVLEYYRIGKEKHNLLAGNIMQYYLLNFLEI